MRRAPRHALARRAATGAARISLWLAIIALCACLLVLRDIDESEATASNIPSEAASAVMADGIATVTR